MSMSVKTAAVDVAERTIFTFIEAFVGAIILAPAINLSTEKAAALSGVAAGLAYLKSTVSTLRSGTITPASAALPPIPPIPPLPVVQTAPAPSRPAVLGTGRPRPVPLPLPPQPEASPADGYSGPVGMVVDGPTALAWEGDQTKTS
jgi:hypothetical protein